MRHSCCKSNQPRTAGRPTEPSSDLRCLNIAHDPTCRTAKIYRFLWSSAALSLLKPASSSFFFFFLAQVISAISLCEKQLLMFSVHILR